MSRFLIVLLALSLALVPAPAPVSVSVSGAFVRVGDKVTITTRIVRRPENRALSVAWGPGGFLVGSMDVTLEGERSESIWNRTVVVDEEGEWTVVAQLRATDRVDYARATFSVR